MEPTNPVLANPELAMNLILGGGVLILVIAGVLLLRQCRR